VGDHTSWLRPYEPPLSTDIEAIARGCAQWVRTTRSAEGLPVDALEAIAGAYGPRAGVASLIIPADFQEQALPEARALPAPESAKAAPQALDRELIERTVSLLRGAKNPLLLLGGPVGDEASLLTAAKIAEAVNAKLLFEQFPRCARRAPGLPSPDKLGYLPFQARSQLGPHDVIVLAGADDPVCVFGYAGETPRLAPAESEVVDPAGAGRDPLQALQAIAALLELPKTPQNVVQKAQHGDVKGHLQPDTLCRTLARLLPEGAVVVDDGITSSLALYPNLTGAAAHDYMSCKGNSIGFALPAATGAAIAAPGRRVVAYSGDGSALYTIQSLWTQAREGLDVTSIICVNQKYAILQMELMRSGGALDGAGKSLTEIGEPNTDFAAIAQGFGVPARVVRDVPSFAAAIEESFRTPGPMLIAAVFG